MYDEYCRNQLANPNHYDNMIVLIMQCNPACNSVDWAISVVNTCIKNAITAEAGSYSSGMCHATRSSISGKIRLFLEPIAGSCVNIGKAIRVSQHHLDIER